MSVKRIEETNDVKGLLTLSKPIPNGQVDSLAYCKMARCKIAADGKPFIQYIFVDTDGTTIRGRMFDISDIIKVRKTITKLNKRIVHIKGMLDYFNSFYIQVKECEPVPSEISFLVADKFFIHSIKDKEEKIKFVETLVNKLGDNSISSLMKMMGTIKALENNSYQDLNKGFSGTPLLVCEDIINNFVTMYTKSEEGVKETVLAIILSEAILSRPLGDEDYSETLRCLYRMQSYVNCDEVTIGVAGKVVALVSDYINFILGIGQSEYDERVLLMKSLRDTSINNRKIKDLMERNLGLFTYNSNIFVERNF